jgi:hypothetical protein
MLRSQVQDECGFLKGVTTAEFVKSAVWSWVLEVYPLERACWEKLDNC